MMRSVLGLMLAVILMTVLDVVVEQLVVVVVTAAVFTFLEFGFSFQTLI